MLLLWKCIDRPAARLHIESKDERAPRLKSVQYEGVRFETDDTAALKHLPVRVSPSHGTGGELKRRSVILLHRNVPVFLMLRILG